MENFIQLVTVDELLEALRPHHIDGLEVAILFAAEAVSPPLELTDQNGSKQYLVDQGHRNEITTLLERRQEITLRQAVGNLRSVQMDLGSLPVGMSDDARSVVQYTDLEFECKGERLKHVSGGDLKQLFSEPQPWHLRAWRYLTTFQLSRVRLNMGQVLDIVVAKTVASAILSARMVAFVTPRLRPFCRDEPFDQCLRYYVDNYHWIGCRSFSSLQKATSVFLGEAPGLLDFSLEEVFSFIRRIESEYRILEERAVIYLERVDPDNKILKRLLSEDLAPRMMDIIRPSIDAATKDLEQLLPEADDVKNLVKKAVTGLV